MRSSLTIYFTAASIAAGVITTDLTTNTAHAQATALTDNPSRNYILQKFNQRSLRNLYKGLIQAQRLSAGALFELTLHPSNAEKYAPKDILAMQIVANQYLCPEGFTGQKCANEALKIPMDSIPGPKTSVAVLEILTRNYNTSIFGIKPEQLNYFVQHLKDHPQEEGLKQRLSKLYTAALKRDMSKFLETTSIGRVYDARGIRYKIAGIKFHKAYSIAKEELEGPQKQPTPKINRRPPMVSFLHKSSVGVLPPTESINRTAVRIALESVRQDFDNLLKFTSYRELPENAQIIEDYISQAVQRIREIKGAKDFNGTLRIEKYINKNCPISCEEARLPPDLASHPSYT